MSQGAVRAALGVSNIEDMEDSLQNLVDEGFSASFVTALQKNLTDLKRYRLVAVFDCDGTLWKGDLGELFFQHQMQQGWLPSSVETGLWPEALSGQFPAKAYDVYEQAVGQGRAREAFGWLVQWCAGLSEIELRNRARAYFEDHFKLNIFFPMFSLVQHLQKAGVEVWAVSGSNYWVVQEACKFFGIDPRCVIASRVRVHNGVLTSQLFDGLIPYADGKVTLIKKYIQKAPFLACGNSYYDQEMLEFSSHLKLVVNSEAPTAQNFNSEQRLKLFAESVITNADSANQDSDSGEWFIQQF